MERHQAPAIENLLKDSNKNFVVSLQNVPDFVEVLMTNLLFSNIALTNNMLSSKENEVISPYELTYFDYIQNNSTLSGTCRL